MHLFDIIYFREIKLLHYLGLFIQFFLIGKIMVYLIIIFHIDIVIKNKFKLLLVY